MPKRKSKSEKKSKGVRVRVRYRLGAVDLILEDDIKLSMTPKESKLLAVALNRAAQGATLTTQA